MEGNYRYLPQLDSPSDLRALPPEALEAVCGELRDYIIRCCARNPGHLGASLGTVELIVGLHYVFNTPDDRIIFDVGHQAYAHKILTGRREAFLQNRRKGGVSGFPNREESVFDPFGTGHSSTSISAALGFARAEKMQGGSRKTVAVIGDGAMAGGLATEALNNAEGADLLVILNDNNRSIDRNIGAFHDYLLKITTNPRYNRLKSHIWNRIGEGRLRKLLQKCTIDAKSSLVRRSGGALFEALGFRYFGPIDGNDVGQVVETLGKLREIRGPKLLHALTVKGKGVPAAEADPTLWHAPGRFNPETFELYRPARPADRYQDVFGEVMLELADLDQRVTAVTPAMCSGCGLSEFAKRKPERFFDVGIEEQHAVTFSAGLAAAGMRPYCNIYSSFSQRAYDQIIHDVALQGLPVVLCLDRGGLVGEDGATHQGCFDMAAYRSVPGAVIAAPRNEIELKNLLYSGLFTESGPYIIRYPRGAGEGTDWRAAKFERYATGKGVRLVRGERIAILGLGPVVNRAAEAAEAFRRQAGWGPSVYDLRFLKPADRELLEAVSRDFQGLLTVEEGCLKGGLFSEVAEYLAETGGRALLRGCGVPDRFIRHDTQAGQRADCGLDAEGIGRALSALAKNLQEEARFL